MKLRRKVTSIILSLAILLSICPHFTSATPDVKAATTSEIPEGYIPIYDISDLYAIRNNLEGNYILMNDIDMTEDTAPGGDYDTGNGWVPINDFAGIFDGNGHRIIGMQIYGEVSTAGGLFNNVGANTKIINLGMQDININITNNYYCAGIIGSTSSDNVSISNCFVTGKISTLGIASGFIASTFYAEDVSISNCYNAASINGIEGAVSTGYSYSSAYTSGILGSHIYYSPYTDHSYNSGIINQGNGLAIGSIESPHCFFLQGTGTNDYNSTNWNPAVSLTETQMKNQNFFTGFDFENTWYIDPYCNYKYPQLKSCPQIRVDSLEIIKPPSKTTYNQGEDLDITGAIVRIIYEDKLEQEILLTEDMLGDYDMNKTGEQQIPVNWVNATTYLDITVKEIPVTSVELNKSDLSIYKGRTETLSASVLPANATDTSITWSVESGDSVTIDQNGTITANKKGVSVVRATSSNGEYAECTVTVNVPCVMLQLNNNEITMNKGDVLSVAETIGYQMSPIDSTDSVTWSSSNDKVLSIDSAGNMTGLAAGSVTVTATSTSGTTALCSVTVQRNIGEFTILGVTNKYYTGNNIKQNIMVSDGTNILKENIDYKVTYQSNKNVGTAKITVTGINPYKGSIVKEFQILELSNETNNSSDDSDSSTTIKAPSRVVIKKITAGKKKLTVSWKKVTGARGYKIQVATNRKFTKGLKTYTVSSSCYKKVVKSLKKKKTYYIRVMAWCNNEEGVILNGKYSKTKKKKTK